MSDFQTIAVPFKVIGNKSVLTHLQVMEDPSLEDFILRFSHCFEQDPLQNVWIFWPEGRPSIENIKEFLGE